MTPEQKVQARDPRYDVLRVLACFGVIFLHATGGLARDPSLENDGLCCLFLHSLFRGAAMPVFFMISGRFLLDRLVKSEFLDEPEVQAFYAKRARRVWLPTLLWSLFFVALAVLDRSLNGVPTSWGETLVGWFVYGKPGVGYHMWFLYALFAIDLAAPTVARAIRRFRAPFLCLLALLSLAFFAVVTTRSLNGGGNGQSDLVVWTLAIGYAPYYYFGWVFSKLENANERLRRWVRRACVVLYLLASVGILWTTYVFGIDYARNEFLPFAVCQTFAAFAYFAASPANIETKLATLWERLAGLTFGVYLVHIAIMPIAARILTRALPGDALLSPEIISIVLAVVTALASGLVVAAMKKIPYVKRVL